MAAAEGRAEPAVAGTGPLTPLASGPVEGMLSGAGAGVGSGGDLQAETSAAPTAMMPASNQWLRVPVERGEGVSGMV